MSIGSSSYKFLFCPWDGTRFRVDDQACHTCGSKRVARAYDGSNKDVGQIVGRPAWRKVLWLKQNYADNFSDHTFLEQLRMNVNIQTYEFWRVVLDGTAIMQQVSLATLFVCLFAHLMQQSSYGTPLLIAANLAVAAFNFGIMRWLAPASLPPMGSIGGRATFFLAVLHTLSPQLGSLTGEISSDTIWSMAAALGLVHLFFMDYVYINGKASPQFQGVLSVNAAIFASVLLASRLPATAVSPTKRSSERRDLVFGLVLLAIQMFALSHIVRRQLRIASVKLCIWFSVLLAVVTFVFVNTLSRSVASIFAAVIVVIVVVCPAGLIHIQSEKHNITGPWDEAKITRALAE